MEDMASKPTNLSDRMARAEDSYHPLASWVYTGSVGLAKVVPLMKSRMLTWFLETGDAVPHETDRR